MFEALTSTYNRFTNSFSLGNNNKLIPLNNTTSANAASQKPVTSIYPQADVNTVKSFYKTYFHSELSDAKLPEAMEFAYSKNYLKRPDSSAKNSTSVSTGAASSQLSSLFSSTQAAPAKQTQQKNKASATNTLNWLKIAQKDPNSRILFCIKPDDPSAEAAYMLGSTAQKLDNVQVGEANASIKDQTFENKNISPWNTAKQELIAENGENPTNAQILERAKEIAINNGISVPEWGIS